VPAYLAAVKAAQARAGDVLLVPGAELVPYYYWTGSWLGGDLTMWGAQRNVLAIGLERAEDYEGLPVIGYRAALPRDPAALARLGLAGLAGAGGAGLLRRRSRPPRAAGAGPRRTGRSGRAGWLCLGLAARLGADAVAATAPDPYRGDLGLAPHQAAIDAVEARGGLAIWSFPEARDFSEERPAGWGPVTVRTAAHPEALVETDRYTAFGAVYGDTVRVTEPGREWDRLLTAYCEGRRARPAWGIGELGYHGPPKPLDEALTVAWADERSRGGLLRALRAGRLYALRPGAGFDLVLDEFAVGQAGAAGTATLGGELAARPDAPVAVHVRLSASDGRTVALAGRLVRSGGAATELAGETPFEAAVTLPAPPPGGCLFVRLEVTRPHALLASPVFVRSPA
jgi:hypothetical protein